MYARVSSQHQTEDLNRQIEFLKSKYPQDRLIKDIGSGLNWKRNGMNHLLNKKSLKLLLHTRIVYVDSDSNGFVVIIPVSETEDRTKELADDLFCFRC